MDTARKLLLPFYANPVLSQPIVLGWFSNGPRISTPLAAVNVQANRIPTNKITNPISPPNGLLARSRKGDARPRSASDAMAAPKLGLVFTGADSEGEVDEESDEEESGEEGAALFCDAFL